MENELSLYSAKINISAISQMENEPKDNQWSMTSIPLPVFSNAQSCASSLFLSSELICIQANHE